MLYICTLKGELHTTEQKQGAELLQDAEPKAGRAGWFWSLCTSLSSWAVQLGCSELLELWLYHPRAACPSSNNPSLSLFTPPELGVSCTTLHQYHSREQPLHLGLACKEWGKGGDFILMILSTGEASQGLKQQLSWLTCQPRASICDWPAATYPENMNTKTCFPTFAILYLSLLCLFCQMWENFLCAHSTQLEKSIRQPSFQLSFTVQETDKQPLWAKGLAKASVAGLALLLCSSFRINCDLILVLPFLCVVL